MLFQRRLNGAAHHSPECVLVTTTHHPLLTTWVHSNASRQAGMCSLYCGAVRLLASHHERSHAVDLPCLVDQLDVRPRGAAEVARAAPAEHPAAATQYMHAGAFMSKVMRGLRAA
eukprot:356781-Chlamydomonas_euryale.AAC.10